MFNGWLKNFPNRHMIKPENTPAPPEINYLDAKIEDIQKSPYFGHVSSLKEKVQGKVVANTVAGTSGFVLYFSDSTWVVAYLENKELRWRYGKGDSNQEFSHLINSSEYGNGYNPLPAHVMYADEICDIGAQLSNSLGKPVTGISTGRNCFNFCFPDGIELNTTIVQSSEGKPALRVFWEQY